MTRKKKEYRGGPKHEPTAEQRIQVWRQSARGANQAHIAAMLGISDRTLRLHYRYELDHAAEEANDAMAGTVYSMGTGGGGPDGWKTANFHAAKYWLSTRAGWKEAAVPVELSGPDGGPIETTETSALEFIERELARLTFRNKLNDEPIESEPARLEADSRAKGDPEPTE